LLPLKKRFTALALALSIISQSSYGNTANQLPDLGSAAAATLSIEKEQRIGKAYMMKLRGQLPVVGDPLLEEYIQDLGHRLVANADDVKTNFNFFLVDNNVINAFAFFGGHVGIHTSLLQLADTESELASVIGHEITHVTQRHLARSIEANAQTNPATVAAMLGSIVLVMAGAPEAGMAGFHTSLALSQQMAINYTRSHEKEADRIGIDLIARSQFDPQGAPSFFEKMAQQSRYGEKLPQMLMSHPVTEARISDTRIRAAEYAPVAIPSQLNFQLAKARVIVRFSDLEPVAIEAMLNKKFKSQDPVQAIALRYGQALLMLDTKQPQQAQALIKSLRLSDPNNLFYVDALTDIYIAQHQANKAVAMLKQYNQIMPNNAVVGLNLANALIKASQPQQAVAELEHLLASQPANVTAWGLLKDAHIAAHNAIGRYTAMAEIAALYGNFEQALKHLYSGYNLVKPQDEITKARLQARIVQLRQARDDLKKLKI